MTLRNQLLIWAGILVGGALMLFLFRSILLPFLVGTILAYLLNPLVTLLQRFRLGRGWATAMVLLSVLAIIVGVFVMIIPMVLAQVIGLVQRLPGYIVALRGLANEWIPALNQWLGADRASQLEGSLTRWLTDIAGLTNGLTQGLAASGATLVNALGLLVVAPVVAFYMLLDWENMTRGVDNLLPLAYRDEIRGLLGDMNKSMAGVFRGIGSVVLVLCFYYATALTLTGLSFGLAIGLMAGLLSFVPFIGFLTAFSLSMVIATVQFWPNWVMMVVVFAVFMIGQFLEGNILYPKLVGSSIGINPVWFIFALFAFTFLFGFVGLLLAVPLAAISAVLLRYAVKKYRESRLYLGETGGAGGDSTAA
ncbi:MAG: putative permease often clustered with de novo purine synthesis [Devosia sp.]|nr:putative permease often clustered with de novo purine synthesis [Devosia sp.]